MSKSDKPDSIHVNANTQDEIAALREIIATYERESNEKDIKHWSELLDLKNRLKNAENAVLDTRYREQIPMVSAADVDRLLKKDQEYGASWKRRGGVGAFMMMVRKIDRIMAQIPEPDGHPKHGFDVFAILADEHADLSESLLDTLRDLRGYAMLIEAEHLVRIGDRTKQTLTLNEKKFFGDDQAAPDLICPQCYKPWFGLERLDADGISVFAIKRYPNHATNGKMCSTSGTWINPLDDVETKSDELPDLVCPSCSKRWEKSRRKDGSLITGHYPQHGNGVLGACEVSGHTIGVLETKSDEPGPPTTDRRYHDDEVDF